MSEIGDITQAELLALLRRTTDEDGWLQPLLDDPDSAAVVLATIEIMARMGAAAQHDRDALTITGASGGQHGSAMLVLTRTGTAAGTIPAGYLFADSRGVRARSQTDVPVPFGALSVFVPVGTERTTELVNTDDDAVFQVAPDAALIPTAPSGADSLIAPPGTLSNGPNTLAVFSSTPISGGAADYLSVHGRERGMLRQPGESEADYRARIRNLTDAVTPLAVAEVARSAAMRAGLPPFRVGEPFDDLATAAIKDEAGLYAIESVYGTADVPGGDYDFFDDEATPMLGRREARAYFQVTADDYLRDTIANAMFFDDGFGDDPVMGYLDAWLTLPPDVLAGLLSLQQQVSVVKGAGINFDVMARSPDALQPSGTTILGVEGDAWSLPADPGTAWMVVGAAVGYSSLTPVPAAACRLRFIMWDGSTLDTVLRTDAGTAYVDRLPPQPVTVIRGRGRSDGSTPLDVVATVLVHKLVAWPP